MWSRFDIPKQYTKSSDTLTPMEYKKEQYLSVLGADGVRQRNEYLDLHHISSSLHIEGTEVSYEDTKAIFEQTMPNHNLDYRSFIECNNLCIAIKRMNELLDSKVLFSRNVLMELHKIVSHGLLSEENSGKIRTCRVMIGRDNYLPAQINQVDQLIDDLFVAIEKITDPIIRAAYFSYNLVSIHPFVDFNGRVSRMCESYILMQNGYPPVVVRPEERDEYIHLIMLAQEHNDSVNTDYISFVQRHITDTMDEEIEAYNDEMGNEP